jgi:hypothetical protein
MLINKKVIFSNKPKKLFSTVKKTVKKRIQQSTFLDNLYKVFLRFVDETVANLLIVK